jgi:hypothetical protein
VLFLSVSVNGSGACVQIVCKLCSENAVYQQLAVIDRAVLLVVAATGEDVVVMSYCVLAASSANQLQLLQLC